MLNLKVGSYLGIFLFLSFSHTLPNMSKKINNPHSNSCRVPDSKRVESFTTFQKHSPQSRHISRAREV